MSCGGIQIPNKGCQLWNHPSCGAIKILTKVSAVEPSKFLTKGINCGAIQIPNKGYQLWSHPDS